MADLRYQVQVDTRGAQQSLQQVQTRVGGLQTAFGGLKTALGALAFGAAIRGSLGFAAAVNDTSTATNVARQSILGLGQALTTNGGQASRATDAVQRFSLTLGQAAGGSKTLQQSFSEVGISMQDLANLDESEILARTIEGLGQIDDAGRRAAIQAQIFGRTMQGVNAAGLAGDFRRLAGEQDRNADAIRRAGEAQDKLNAAMNRFQLAVIRTIGPMVDAFNRISDENLERLIESFVKLAAAAASIAVVIKASQLLTLSLAALATAGGIVWATFKSGIAGTVLAWAKFGTATATAGKLVVELGRLFAIRFTSIGGILARVTLAISTLPFIFKSLGVAAGAFVVPLLKIALVLSGVAAAVVGLNQLIKFAFNVDPLKFFGDQLSRLTQSVREFFGAASAAGTVSMAVDPGIQNAVRSQQQIIANRTVINQQLDQETRKIQDTTKRYREQNAEFAKRFEFQTRLLNLTDRQRLVEETMADAQQEYLSSIEPLVRRIQEIKESGNAADLEAIPLLKQGIADITQEYQAQIPALQQLLAARLQQLDIQQQSARLEEQATAAAERRAAVEDEVQKIIVNGTRRIRDAYDQVQLEGLSGIARELRRIEIEERRLAEAARERVAAQFGDNDPEGLGRALDQIKQASDEIVRRRQATMRTVMQEQRSFAAGWRRAWAEYQDAATNASKTAETVFRKTTQGMEDALVDFVKTGRFEWRNFVADILEELLRSQIREVIASIGGALGGVFGSIGGGGSAQSRGSSPTNPMFVVDVAGGITGGGSSGSGLLGGLFGSGSAATPGINPNAPQPGGGGGLLGGIGNVVGSIGSGIGTAVKSVGTVLGSIGSGIGSAVKTVTSSIGNVVGGLVSGVKNLFGGFFATGGTLPRGKFGVVGERGPELIRGPGDITPLSMGGGATNVTYNIQAVDAVSFQQLVARDPGFIHAVAMQGARGMPMGRR